ncbi:MAG: hypothetical protein Q9192_002263 [Flavoplaca navasiana]
MSFPTTSSPKRLLSANTSKGSKRNAFCKVLILPNRNQKPGQYAPEPPAGLYYHSVVRAEGYRFPSTCTLAVDHDSERSPTSTPTTIQRAAANSGYLPSIPSIQRPLPANARRLRMASSTTGSPKRLLIEVDMPEASKRNEVSLGKEILPRLGDGGLSVGVVSAGGGAASAALKQELNTMKETVTGLEREGDFYFSKWRDIELLLQQACDDNPELEKEENG